MKYIVSGPSLGKLIQENRIRISRGELTFTPLVGAASSVEVAENSVEETPVEEGKDVAVEDSKDVEPTDTKSPKAKTSKK